MHFNVVFTCKKKYKFEKKYVFVIQSKQNDQNMNIYNADNNVYISIIVLCI